MKAYFSLKLRYGFGCFACEKHVSQNGIASRLSICLEVELFMIYHEMLLFEHTVYQV